jgi:uncharacterized LabA/DUF88 family protein
MNRVQRVLVFVDERNAVSAAKSFNRRFGWLQLRHYLADPEEGRELMEMVVYVGLPPSTGAFEERRTRKDKFVNWLRMNGFLAVVKEGSPAEQGHFKANVDVLMAIDAMDLAVEAHPDIVVLVTGDSDFAHLAYRLRRRGIRVEVASVSQTLGGQLRAAANDVIDLAELFNKFEPLRGAEADAIGTDDVFDAELA